MREKINLFYNLEFFECKLCLVLGLTHHAKYNERSKEKKRKNSIKIKIDNMKINK